MWYNVRSNVIVFIIAIRSSMWYKVRHVTILSNIIVVTITGVNNFSFNILVFASETNVVWWKRDEVITMISSLELEHAFWRVRLNEIKAGVIHQVVREVLVILWLCMVFSLVACCWL